MKIYHDTGNFRVDHPVLTIGTFDGVHLGHMKIIARLKEIASEIRGETVIFTFHPHPRQILTPEEHNLRLIHTLHEKTERLETAGIDHLIIYPFSAEFALMSYADFVKDILIDRLKTSCLVVGYDHKFGRQRRGDYEYLTQCAERYNFRIERLDPLLVDEVHVSSTRIREALEAGEITLANKFLGYPYELQGTVVKGEQIGRKIGFPTANIEASEVSKLIPGYGVYAVKVILEGHTCNGMLNIGTRPTFNLNADARSIEVNIFDFDDFIYGQDIKLVFYAKIREEQKFPGKEALTAQLHRDKLNALKILQ